MAVLAALASVSGLSVSGADAAALWNQLDPAAAASAGGASSGHPSNVIISSEDAPCDPTPASTTAAPKPAHRPPRRRPRTRPVVHKVVLHRTAPVVPKPAPLHRPTIHKAIRHKVVARRRRLRVAPAALVAAPKRCVTLHSERLNRAGLVYDGAPAAALDPATAGLDPAAALTPPAATPDFGLAGAGAGGGPGGGGGGGGGGGAAFPNAIAGGARGGVATDPGQSSSSVSAAPEPQTWMLMIVGVGLCGLALRRARRTARCTV